MSALGQKFPKHYLLLTDTLENKNMNKLILSFVLLSSSALASPASELLREASFYMAFHYHGYSGVKPEELSRTLSAELETACKPKGEACGFEDARPFVQRLARGMRDGHTFFLSPSNYRNALAEFRGENINPSPVYGFGLGNANSRGEVPIEDVIADSPAYNAGLRPFDRVIGARNQKFGNLSELRQLLNTSEPVTLEVLRGDAANPVRLSVTMQRATLTKTNLPYLYQPPNAPAGVVALRIPTFTGSNDIAPRVHELVARAQSQNATAIVIDVRDNPGGEETECYGAASAFVGRAVNINETRLVRLEVGFDGGRFIGNDPKDLSRYEIAKPALWTGKTLVLTNAQTASCGELLAYLLQYNKKAPVLGESTYGILDTATEFWQLADQSALAITYVRTLNPDGSRVPERVTPDVAARDSPSSAFETGRDPLFEKAYDLLR
jgi:carboxyl-terminal processing protease